MATFFTTLSQAKELCFSTSQLQRCARKITFGADVCQVDGEKCVRHSLANRSVVFPRMLQTPCFSPQLHNIKYTSLIHAHQRSRNERRNTYATQIHALRLLLRDARATNVTSATHTASRTSKKLQINVLPRNQELSGDVSLFTVHHNFDDTRWNGLARDQVCEGALKTRDPRQSFGRVNRQRLSAT